LKFVRSAVTPRISARMNLPPVKLPSESVARSRLHFATFAA